MPPLTRFFLAAAAVHLVLGWLLFDPALFPGGDNAGYMILGESLRTGRGYLDLYLPHAPVHTKYPPVYPLVLAGLGWLGGLQLFKFASLACTAGAVWLTGRVGRRLAGPVAGALAAGLVAVSPVLLEYSHYVLSEALFTLLVLGALAAYEGRRRTSPGAESARPGASAPGTASGVATGSAFAIALAAGAAAFLTRTAAIPLLAALALHLALGRAWRRAAVAAGIGAAVLGGWALFQTLGPAGEPGYLQQLVLVDPYAPAAGTIGFAGLFERAATNLWLYLSEALPASLGVDPGGAAVGPRPLALFLGVVVAGLALAGWLREAVRGLRLSGLFTCLYIGLIALWPSIWTDRRFMLPVLPLLLIYTMAGAGMAARWVTERERWRMMVPAGVAFLLALPAAASAAGLVSTRLRCRFAPDARALCIAPPFASFLDAARWARDQTPEDAVFANRKPRIFYWISNRRGDVYRYSGEPRLVLRSLEAMGADYVVVDRLSFTTVTYLIPAIRSRADRFVVAHSTGEPPTLVLRFAPEPQTAKLP